MKTVFVWAGLALTSVLAAGLEPSWQYDTACGSFALPAVENPVDTAVAPQILIATRFDGTVYAFDGKGTQTHQTAGPAWIDSAVVPVRGPLVAWEESSGRLVLRDIRTGAAFPVGLEGDPLPGKGLCSADLNGDQAAEILCARRNGLLTALDSRENLGSSHSALWQYDAGAPLAAGPAVAPVFVGATAVYVCSEDGVVHALLGDGRPLWQFRTGRAVPSGAPVEGPLVVELEQGRASVLWADAEGGLWALDAVNGRERWHVEIGHDPLGSPAILDARSGSGRRIVVVGQQGTLAEVDATGRIEHRTTLPPGAYVPRPLVADVDGDGDPEILVANQDWAILVATLDGRVKETIRLRGNAVAGMVMADLAGGGALDLIATTDCAAVYCFATLAKTGWTHPRAGFAGAGAVFPLDPAPLPEERKPRRRVRVDSVTLGSLIEWDPAATAVIRVRKQQAARYVSAVLRRQGRVVGATVKPIGTGTFSMPFLQKGLTELALDLRFLDKDGAVTAATLGWPVLPMKIQLVKMAPPDGFLDAASELAAAFGVPSAWDLPVVRGRDWWYVDPTARGEWERYGLAKEPLATEAIRCVDLDPEGPVFGPSHPEWSLFRQDPTPFFVQDPLLFQRPYPTDAWDALVDMAGARFLGFIARRWAERAYPTHASELPPHVSIEDLTAVLREKFKQLLSNGRQRVCTSQASFLYHHQAFEWGAPAGFAELGGDTPCASLQLAFLRGASRQFGGMPWGVQIVNTFCDVEADTLAGTDPSKVRWAPPRRGAGRFCGHSPSLEGRLEMAAHLAGATLLEHMPNAGPGPDTRGVPLVQREAAGNYTVSQFGAAMETVLRLARDFPERGVPYTPMAFLIDFHRGWRIADQDTGPWPTERSDQSIDAVFRHAFGWNGRRDLEHGYLSNAPYGEIFDVVTDNAPFEVLRNYAVLWPLGDIVFGGAHRDKLMDYARQGGILVLDAGMAADFPSLFLGVAFESDTRMAAQIQTALAASPPMAAPYSFRRMTVNRSAGALAWTDNGAPLLTWRPVGDGMVIVSACDHWIDERGHLLPLAPVLLRVLADALLPVQVAGDVEMFLNYAKDGWLIGLVNNNGVAKTPAEPIKTDPKDAADCVLHFKKGVPLQFLPRIGEFRWDTPMNGLVTRIQSGGVAVVKAVFPQ